MLGDGLSGGEMSGMVTVGEMCVDELSVGEQDGGYLCDGDLSGDVWFIFAGHPAA